MNEKVKIFVVSCISIFIFTGFRNDHNKTEQKQFSGKTQIYSSIFRADALALPLPVCGIFYLDDVDLLGQFVPQKVTPIFSEFSYYYSDSNFTTFVPDGYYSDPNTLYVIPTGYRLYFHIVDGRITEHIYVESDVEDPGAPWCP